MTKHNRFAKGSGCYKCADCGKLTRKTGNEYGDYCAACTYRGEVENGHYDGAHGLTPHADCPLCQQEG